MSEESGVSEEVISLPEGGGAVEGTGGQFATDLQTGAGQFTLPLDLPDGRNGFGPSVQLSYSSGNGNGSFGLGWSVSVPSVSRKTETEIPRYDGTDAFRTGGDDLVAVEEGDGKTRYRPRIEGEFGRIVHHDDGETDHWVTESTGGSTNVFGTPNCVGEDPAAVADPADRDRVYRWALTETVDPFGNRIEYEYRRDASEGRWDQLYVDRIRYVEYDDGGDEDRFLVSVDFEYDERPDPFSRHRPGFEVRTRLRCSAITVRTRADESRRVRSYEFTYRDELGEPPANGLSLLGRVDVVGYDGEETQRTPPVEFEYADFEPGQRSFEQVDGSLPRRSLADPELELADLFGDGLPDVVEIDGTVRYWRNLGDGEFDEPKEMERSPAGLSLADPGVRLMDADGDGRVDLVADSGPLSGYFPLGFDGEWDAESFRPYRTTPSVDLGDPNVTPIDLDGNGATDLMRSGSRLEYFFQDPDEGWTSTRQTPRDPDVDFGDPRVRIADLSGDGLADLVVVRRGSVEYWPNQGYGDWGRRVRMENPPRLPADLDPGRVLVGDVDGDGHADLAYVEDDSVLLWLNRSGNGWSDPFEVTGTPSVTDADAVRLVDLHGQGVSGVLWSGTDRSETGGTYFLSFTGGRKPHLLTGTANNLGARTDVSYAPSTEFLLADREDGDGWETTLPSPTWVVDQVEVADEIAGGKLTHEYAYHHGYWDGAEREFRGFGMVEQRDTESFADYDGRAHDGGRAGPLVTDRERFSPPKLTKTWFHLGPVGPERGDWRELDYREEFWNGGWVDATGTADASWLGDPAERLPDGLDRRTRRDAVRALRGSELRTEVYALDGTDREDRPYEVQETRQGVRTEYLPDDRYDRHGVFFPYGTASRTTRWERGDDPLTRLSFSGDYDAYGQPRATLSVACPRGWDPLTRPDASEYLAKYAETSYAQRTDDAYIVDRVSSTATYEVIDDASRSVRELWDAVRAGETGLELVGLTRNYYDGEAFEGRPLGELGDYGARVRTEELALTDQLVGEVYDEDPLLADAGPTPDSGPPTYLQSDAPDWEDAYPDAFRTGVADRAGYLVADVSGRAGSATTGYFTVSKQVAYDFQLDDGGSRGLKRLRRDPLDNETEILAYEYDLHPVRVRDPAGLVTEAEYDYSAMRPREVTDSNGNRSRNGYTPLGMLSWVARMGTDGQQEGDTPEQPGKRYEYDLRAYERSPDDDPQPAYVHVVERERHRWDVVAEERDRRGRELTEEERAALFADEQQRHPERFVQSREYSDGFGNVVQTRTRAEDAVYEGSDGGPALTADGADDPDEIVERDRSDEEPRVKVDGWKTYDNKGNVVEAYEPFFATGWSYLSRAEAASTRPDDFERKVETFYDALGRTTRTVEPDGSASRTVRGVPRTLAEPDEFEPTPWEVYEYGSTDNAGRTHAAEAADYNHRWNTPTSHRVDARGREIETVERNRQPDEARTDGGGSAAPDAGEVATDGAGAVAGDVPVGRGEPVERHTVYREYDARGNVTRITDELGREAFSGVYDLTDARLRTESIDAGIGWSVRDAAGNVLEQRDGNGTLDLQRYDSTNRSAFHWARDGGDPSSDGVTLRTRVVYGDADEDLDREAARDGNLLGNVSRLYDEAGLVEFEAYDFKGSPKQKYRTTLADGAVAGGPVDWTVTDGALPDRETSLLSDRTYESSLEYDAMGRVQLRRYPEDVGDSGGSDGTGDGRKALRFHYTPSGSLSGVEMLPGDGSEPETFVEAVGYDAKGRRALVAYGNGVMTRHAYDETTYRLVRSRTERFERPTDGGDGSDDGRAGTDAAGDRYRPAGDVFRDVTFEYDVGGSLLESRNEAPGAGVAGGPHGRDVLERTFEYDALNRLTKATGRECTTIPQPRPWSDAQPCGYDSSPGGQPAVTRHNAPQQTAAYTERYDYDPAGNLLEMNHTHHGDGGSWTRHFGYGGNVPADWNPAPGTEPDGTNRLTHVGDDAPRPGGPTHEYDASGNLLSERNARYRWDYADRLRSYTEQKNGTTSVEASYAYGSEGRRVKKVVDKGEYRREVTEYVDGVFEYHRLETDRTAGDGGVVRENNTLHVTDGSNRVALRRIGQPFDGGEPYATSNEPAVEYRIQDRLGSCSLAIAGDGGWLNVEEYAPFGETTFGGYAKKRYRFTGKERDEESGLYYHGKRYYAPWLARWTTTDPEGIQDGLNLYPYVKNDPVNATDPTGGNSDESNENGGGTTTNLAPEPEGEHGTELKPVGGSNGQLEAHYQFPEMEISGSANGSGGGSGGSDTGSGSNASGSSQETGGTSDEGGGAKKTSDAASAASGATSAANMPEGKNGLVTDLTLNLWTGGGEDAAKSASGYTIHDLAAYSRYEELAENTDNARDLVWKPASHELAKQAGLSGKSARSHGLVVNAEKGWIPAGTIQYDTEVPTFAKWAQVPAGLSVVSGGFNAYAGSQMDSSLMGYTTMGAGVAETTGGVMYGGTAAAHYMGFTSMTSPYTFSIAGTSVSPMVAGQALMRYGGGVGTVAASAYSGYRHYQQGDWGSLVGYDATGMTLGAGMLLANPYVMGVGAAGLGGYMIGRGIDSGVGNLLYGEPLSSGIADAMMYVFGPYH